VGLLLASHFAFGCTELLCVQQLPPRALVVREEETCLCCTWLRTPLFPFFASAPPFAWLRAAGSARFDHARSARFLAAEKWRGVGEGKEQRDTAKRLVQGKRRQRLRLPPARATLDRSAASRSFLVPFPRQLAACKAQRVRVGRVCSQQLFALPLPASQPGGVGFGFRCPLPSLALPDGSLRVTPLSCHRHGNKRV